MGRLSSNTHTAHNKKVNAKFLSDTCAQTNLSCMYKPRRSLEATFHRRRGRVSRYSPKTSTTSVVVWTWISRWRDSETASLHTPAHHSIRDVCAAHSAPRPPKSHRHRILHAPCRAAACICPAIRAPCSTLSRPARASRPPGRFRGRTGRRLRGRRARRGQRCTARPARQSR